YTGTTIDPVEGSITGGVLAIVNADGTGKQGGFTSEERGSPFEPAWAPDGRQIAFKRDFDTGGPGEIWVVSPSGTGLHRLNRDGEAPSWSPDSKQLVYAGFDARGNYRIYVMNRDGSHRIALGSCPRNRACGVGADPDWHR